MSNIAPNKAYLDQIMICLVPLGSISSKPMFGGYGIFHEGHMFALISGNGLFFKVDDSNRALYLQSESRQYKPMPYFQVPAEVFEDATKLLEWARLSVSIAHDSASLKKR